jgi:hypothetical protein
MATGRDRERGPFGCPEGSSLVCAHVQPEVAQYPPSGVFSPEVTSSNINRKLRNIRSNVTRRASPGRVECANARPNVPNNEFI